VHLLILQADGKFRTRKVPVEDKVAVNRRDQQAHVLDPAAVFTPNLAEPVFPDFESLAAFNFEQAGYHENGTSDKRLLVVEDNQVLPVRPGPKPTEVETRTVAIQSEQVALRRVQLEEEAVGSNDQHIRLVAMLIGAVFALPISIAIGIKAIT